MFSCKYWEISKKSILKNICVRLLLKRLQEVIDQDFLSGESLSKTPRLSNITKVLFAFKPDTSLNVTPALYLELRFPIFIINGYLRKANACSPWTSCFNVVPSGILNFSQSMKKMKSCCYLLNLSLSLHPNFSHFTKELEN